MWTSQVYGHHDKMARTKRICQHYLVNLNIQCIEDEFHVFFICNKYRQLRQQYLLSWYAVRFAYGNLCTLMMCSIDNPNRHKSFLLNKSFY